MPSTAIRDIDYDAEQQKLYVTFVTGRRYVYYAFPEDEYHAFRGATSKGTFFNHRIRDRYRFEELIQHPA